MSSTHWITSALDTMNCKTSHGEDITFDFSQDEKFNNGGNSLWEVNTINAFIEVNGEKIKAGFINLSMIPESVWEETMCNHPFLPEVVMYSIKRNGFAVSLEGSENEILQALSIHVSLDLCNSKKLLNLDTSDPEYQELKHYVFDRIQSMKIDLMENTKDFHINKPSVDFISVHDDHQRKGIGNALYMAASFMLHDNGYPLYSSLTKTESGKANFKRFCHDNPHLIRKENDRYMVSPAFEYHLDDFC